MEFRHEGPYRLDAESSLIHTVIGTAANVNEVTQGHGLLNGDERIVFADAGYQGANKRAEATAVNWQASVRPGKRRALDKRSPWAGLLDKAEQLKSSVRAKVEQFSRVIKCQSASPRCAACNANCAEYFVDGTSTFHGKAGLSASAVQASACEGSEKAPNQRLRALRFGDNPLRVSSGALLTINSRESGGCVDLPHQINLDKTISVCTFDQLW